MTEITQEWIAERRAALPGELLALVAAQPGLPKTHYIYLKIAEGGLRGLTQDKYVAMDGLLAEGKLVLGPSLGRRKGAGVRGVYPQGVALPGGDEHLRAGMLALVKRAPGCGSSYYCRLSPKDGGLLGSQERKEQMLKSLLESGDLVAIKLPAPRGRLTHTVHLPMR